MHRIPRASRRVTGRVQEAADGGLPALGEPPRSGAWNAYGRRARAGGRRQREDHRYPDSARRAGTRPTVRRRVGSGPPDVLRCDARVRQTDEGLTGIGSGDTMAGFDAHAHHFIGEDPLRMVRHVETIESINFHAGRYWPVEVALWDIVGQVCGQPVATLFGGDVDRLPVYASCG